MIDGINTLRGQKPAEMEAHVPITGVKGELRAGEPPFMTIKGTQQQVQQALTPYEQQQQRNLQAQGVPNTPENNTDKAAYQRGEISYDELSRRVQSRAAGAATTPPAPIRQPGMPGAQQGAQPSALPSPSPPVESTTQAAKTSEKLDIPARSFTSGRDGNQIQNVILHSSDGREHSDLQTLTQGDVSAHYYVTREGDVYHLVNDNDTAYHAGVVSKPEYSNAATLGIEQEHYDPGKEYPNGEDWPDAQVQATARLTAGLLKENGLSLDDVKSHSQIASPAGRKQDPYGYPWDRFNKLVANYYAQEPGSAPRVSPDQLEPNLGGRLSGHGNDFIDAGKK
jgi:N-acetyl-anhydromuramyl-L-alanine amidase AmpD